MQKSASSSSTTSAKKAQNAQSTNETSTSFKDLLMAYHKQTTASCKALDGYLAFCTLTGVIQATYCLLVSSFPFNAFIGVFAASIGSFVFAANLRLKWSKVPGQEPSQLEVIHSVIEFLVCSLILHMFVANFIG